MFRNLKKKIQKSIEKKSKQNLVTTLISFLTKNYL